jgi:omega-6 fatty acid desaturase (delta-12 desaturase)
MTVKEYATASRFKRLQYRRFRNPLVLFLFGPAYVLLIEYRFAGKGDGRRQTVSRYITNSGIAALLLLAFWLIGWRSYLVIQLPILVIAGACGFWLFYIQHQFEGVYWARHNTWDPMKASLEGSSFYQLPVVLQWFSGNIGFHHIHHMRPRIPNYHLQQCQIVMAPWLIISPLRLRDSLRSLRLKLWDEKQNRLVGFRAAKATE